MNKLLLSARTFCRTFCPLLCGLLLLTGCVTAPDGTSKPNIPRIAAVVKEATTIGTLTALVNRPEWETHFQIVHARLVDLEQKDSITVNELLDIVAALPVRELKSDEARIAISVARITIAGADWSVIDVERLNQIRPIVTAFREGLEDGGVPKS